MKDFKNSKQQQNTLAHLRNKGNSRNNSKQLPPPLRDSAEQKYAGGIFLREVVQKGGGSHSSTRKAAFTLAGGRRPLLNSGYRRAAFTLAEVLITLAVIGIVAVLTIPNLIVSYEKKATATKVKKAFVEFNQAIKLSEIENGAFANWDLGTKGSVENTRRFMEQYILPYYSGITECSTGINSECGIPVSGAGVNYRLNNGTGLSLLASPFEKKIYIMISTNISKGEKAIMGKDGFYFVTNNDQIFPFPGYIPDGVTREDILNDGFIIQLNSHAYNIACRKERRDRDDGIQDLKGEGCALLLYMDNWEFKDDYPW